MFKEVKVTNVKLLVLLTDESIAFDNDYFEV